MRFHGWWYRFREIYRNNGEPHVPTAGRCQELMAAENNGFPAAPKCEFAFMVKWLVDIVYSGVGPVSDFKRRGSARRLFEAGHGYI